MTVPTPAERDRGSLLVEDARVVRHEHHPGGQGRIELDAPGIARRARPGSFVHLRCDPLLPMRRPMSIMGARDGRIEILYKVTGTGTRLLAGAGPGTSLSLLGPIGRPFAPDPSRPRKILVAGGVGLPPLLFLAETLVAGGHPAGDLALLYGSEEPFPFALHVGDGPQGPRAGLLRTHALGIPTRLASRRLDRPGLHRGFVTELLAAELAALAPGARERVEVAACGPAAMLREVQRLLRFHGVKGELCLEEWMACAVGGCGGCTVSVRTPSGPAMKRVCVDGPVFAAETVVFAA